MTTHYIQTLGVAKCREILKGAPETATNYCDDKYYEEWSYSGWVVSDGSQWIDCKKPKGDLISLSDLRHELSLYDTDHCSDIRNHISPLTVVIER